LQSPGENDIKNELHFTSFPSSQSVQVEWRAITKLHWYPWEKFGSIIYDKQLGPQMEQSLLNLSQLLEKAP